MMMSLSTRGLTSNVFTTSPSSFVTVVLDTNRLSVLIVTHSCKEGGGVRGCRRARVCGWMGRGGGRVYALLQHLADGVGAEAAVEVRHGLNV